MTLLIRQSELYFLGLAFFNTKLLDDNYLGFEGIFVTIKKYYAKFFASHIQRPAPKIHKKLKNIDTVHNTNHL